MLKKTKAQIWVETVIYTLIGLSIIGILLSIVKPAIDDRKDKILIEKSLEMMSVIEEQIEDIRYYGTGNSRTIETKLTKGKLEINVKDDYIEFLMESGYMYSEPGQEVNLGKITALTKETSGNYDISLKLNYSMIVNLTWDSEENNQILQPAPTPHKITVTNKGKVGDLIQIDFS